jgi:hypothetical protein
MQRRLAYLSAVVASGVMAGVSLMAPVKAGEIEMKPEEAKRFIANKLFSYSCFDGTKGAGRIHPDGSVVGTMQANGRTRYVSLPAGTIRLTADSICASLPRAIIQPCFNVVQTSSHSFRGSLKGLSFAYCDFEHHNARLDLAERAPSAREPSARQPGTHAAESAVALRPSRY